MFHNPKKKMINKTKLSPTKASLITRDLVVLSKPTGNLYEAVAVIGKRSNQISAQIKEELNAKLADFATTVDNLEEVFENREQIEISKHYERMPKPTIQATEEFLNYELVVIRPNPEEDEI